mgnify:CR=1 FL=1
MFDLNEYFEGKVKSIAFKGEKLSSTVGVMSPGDYIFATTQKEVMTVVSGQLIVTLPGEVKQSTFKTGESFIILAHKEFKVTVITDTAYLCTYE